jgi:Flp pilus assembly pilin Flp
MMRQSNPTFARKSVWRRFIADNRAATAIEYSLMAAGIGLAIMGTISSAGQAIKTTLWDQIVTALSSSSR